MGSGLVAQVTLTVDVVILRDGEDGQLEVLLIERGKAPYQGMWALPGGKMDTTDASLEVTAMREVWEETGLSLSRLHQVETFGDIHRDPRGRYVSVLYVAVVPPSVSARPGDDAVELAWFPIGNIPVPLAFDHKRLLWSAFQVIGGSC